MRDIALARRKDPPSSPDVSPAPTSRYKNTHAFPISPLSLPVLYSILLLVERLPDGRQH